MSEPLRIAVMISGNGSNLQAILDAIQDKALDASMVLVVSNRKDAYGLERARTADVATLYFPMKPYRKAARPRTDYDKDLAAKVAAYQPDLIVLAGWMHILSSHFLNAFPQRVINLHPALSGEFPGTNAIQRAFAAFQRGEIDHSGVMVHFAVPEVDQGSVIVQRRVPLREDDTIEAFEARMHHTEHKVIVEAIQLWAERFGYIGR